MEKIKEVSGLMMKFSILWEILPFYGHFPIWKYLMMSASIKTKMLWIKNEKAFKELSKDMKMSAIKYEKPFDNEYNELFLRIGIKLNCSTVEQSRMIPLISMKSEDSHPVLVTILIRESLLVFCPALVP